MTASDVVWAVAGLLLMPAVCGVLYLGEKYRREYRAVREDGQSAEVGRGFVTADRCESECDDHGDGSDSREGVAADDGPVRVLVGSDAGEVLGNDEHGEDLRGEASVGSGHTAEPTESAGVGAYG